MRADMKINKERGENRKRGKVSLTSNASGCMKHTTN